MNHYKVTRKELLGVFILALIIGLMNTINVYDKLGGASADVIIRETLLEFGLVILELLLGILIYFIIKQVVRWIDLEELKISLRIFALKLNEKIKGKNDNIIYPRLQGFLFYVLKKHNDALQLPLGEDMATLTPYGPKYVLRQNCRFYCYQMILPTPLERDANVLRKLFQQYVVSEIINYGIIGLNSVYNTPELTYPSVYVDRVVIEEESSLLTFEVLYVSSMASAFYLKRALERDQRNIKPEQEVYDDEIC